MITIDPIRLKEIDKQSKEAQAKVAARERALAKLSELGLTPEEIASL